MSGTELSYSLLSACSVYEQGGRTRSFDPPEPGLPVPIAGIKYIQRLEVHANHRGLGLEEAKLKSGCKDRVIAGWSGLRDCWDGSAPRPQADLAQCPADGFH